METSGHGKRRFDDHNACCVDEAVFPCLVVTDPDAA